MINKSDIVAVIGAGTMGMGIVQVAAQAGHPVIVYDVDEASINNNVQILQQRVDAQVAKGKRTAEYRSALFDRISTTTDITSLGNAKLVIEAIVENLSVKQTVFRQLEEVCCKEAILASNTSSLSITAIAAGLTCPQRFLGMHFFNPAPVLPLVEIISGLATSANVAQAVYDLAKEWGKSPVHASSTPGFIVNRVARPFYAEGLRLLEEGAADAATLDAIARESGGFRMGPFELMDLIGHDVNYAVTESVFNAYYSDPKFKPSIRQKALVEAGFLGRKAGRGFYNYEASQTNTAVSAQPSARPNQVTMVGECAYNRNIFEAAKDAGISVDIKPLPVGGRPCLLVDDTVLSLSEGLSATEIAAQIGHDNCIVYDLFLNFTDAKRIAIAAALQADEQAFSVVAGLFQALGKEVSSLQDIPGMLLTRTVAMLANEAMDTVYLKVACEEDVDIAMRQGVNYPLGPIAWARQIGYRRVHTALTNLQSVYGDDRYRPSPRLRQLMLAGE